MSDGCMMAHGALLRPSDHLTRTTRIVLIVRWRTHWKVLLDFLVELDRRKIFYRLSRPREEALMVEAAVPGERWEVEFFPDGHVEVERFGRSTGVATGSEADAALEELFLKHSD